MDMNKTVNMSQVSKICVKRLQGDAKILAKHPVEGIDAYQDDKDMLIWYFLLEGPVDTHYEGGLYIGKVMHSPEYPFKAPDFMMLTPTGRFEIGKKICMTNSGYHSESWSSMWNIRSILLGFISIMSDDTTSGISHIKKSKAERQVLAKESQKFNETYHKDIYDIFLARKSSLSSKKSSKGNDGNDKNDGDETVEVKPKKRVKKVKSDSVKTAG